jgi:hypothetical protein
MYINRPDLFVDIPPFIMGYTNLLLTSLHLLYPVVCSLYLTLSTPYFSSFAPSVDMPLFCGEDFNFGLKHFPSGNAFIVTSPSYTTKFPSFTCVYGIRTIGRVRKFSAVVYRVAVGCMTGMGKRKIFSS